MRYLVFCGAAVGMVAPAFGQSAMMAHAQICPGTPEPVPGSALAAKLKRSTLSDQKKDEFETTAQFQARIRQQADREFPGSTVSVAVKVSPYKISYNADAGTLTLEMARSDYAVKRSGLSVTEIESSSRVTGRYAAQNSYGAEIEVEERSDSEFVIAWPGLPSYGVKVDLHVSSDDARILKQNDELVIVGSIAEPFLQRRYNLDLPTMDSPTRRTTESYALTLSPSCLYLRDINGKAFGLRLSKAR